MKPFTQDDVVTISRRLDNYHGVFSQLWSLGTPVLTTTVPTAAVWFDDIGDALHMEINPMFWKTLSQQQQDFIICHECLHVMLDHGRRMTNVTNRDAANIAADVVINELLVSEFGFDRKEIDPTNQYCWRDKLPPNVKVAVETYEAYYNQLMKNSKAGDTGKLVDDHSKLSAGDATRFAKRVIEKLSQGEVDDLTEKLTGHDAQDSSGRSDEAGGFMQVMEAGIVRPKPKWESIVKRRLLKYINDTTVESWLKTNRRLSAFHDKALLPSEVEDEGHTPDRARIYLFLDTSGSCASLAPRFWKLAMSIPRSKFDIRPFCFDTKVYPVNFKDRKVYGFGGTSFHIIENKIKKELADGLIPRYPEAVFVITDGYGTRVHPEIPKNWHVLLTKDGSNDCFPSTVHFYDLQEFE